jgi:class 3 adenylate cyclase
LSTAEILKKFKDLFFELPPEVREEFEVEIRKSSIFSIRFICWIALFLYPLFGFLDWILFPEQYRTLISIRCIVVPFIFLILFLTYTANAMKMADVLGFALFQCLALGITTMIVLTGGESSPYYAGLSMVMLAQLVALSWGFRKTALNVVVIWLTYLALVFIFDKNYNEYQWPIFIANNFFLLGTMLIVSIWSILGLNLHKKSFLHSKMVEQEKERSDQLLGNILPEPVIAELKTNHKYSPQIYESATVLFTDFVGFTKIAEKMKPEDVVLELDRAFEFFDLICDKYHLEKIKTIGDSFMCVAGVPVPNRVHAIQAALMGIEIRSFNRMLNQIRSAVGEEVWNIRIGIHTGPLAAGVIGRTRFRYDIWGDTVNVASLMESSGDTGKISISGATYNAIKPYFMIQYRGIVSTKKRGELEMYFVDCIKPEYADDELGRTPNKRLLEIIG